jgi:hypothetical protein
MKLKCGLLLVGVGLLVGCGAPTAEIDNPAAAADVVSAKAAFFGDDQFYFVRINGWDPNKNSHDAIHAAPGEKIDAPPQAEVLIYASSPQSPLHCPDDEVKGSTPIYRGKGFSLGMSGNLTDNTPKSSFKIKLADDLFGMKKIVLKSMWNDVSQMRESIAWSIFGKLGIVASRQVYAKFCINEKYYGLYSIIENVDSAMFAERFGAANAKGNLFKANWVDIPNEGPALLDYRGDAGSGYFSSTNMDARRYQLDSGSNDPKAQSYDDLAMLARAVNGIGLPGGDERFDTDEYKAQVERIFNVRAFLRWAGANILFGAWDNYVRTPGNYLVYNSGLSGASDVMSKPYFTWIPWDYDNTFGIDYFNKDWAVHDLVDWERDNVSGQKLPLITSLLKNQDYLRYYLDHLEFLLDTEVDVDKVKARIGGEEAGGANRTGLWARISSAAFLESNTPTGAPHTGRQFTNDEVFRAVVQSQTITHGMAHIPGVTDYLQRRVANAREQLEAWRMRFPKGSSGVTFPVTLEPLPSP